MRGRWSLDSGQLFGVNYVRQSPESGMVKLRASMSVEEVDDGYFYAADLKAFARQLGIAVGRRRIATQATRDKLAFQVGNQARNWPRG